MSRRAVGSIRPAGSQRWIIQISVGRAADGKRRRITRRFAGTRQEAEAEFARLLSTVPSTSAPSTLTVSAFLSQWLASKDRRQKTTVEGYETYLRIHILPALGHLRLTKLSVLTLQQWLANVQGGERTRHHAYSVLRNALNQAVKWDLIPRNPLNSVERPKPPKAEIIRPTLEEALAIIKAVHGTVLEPAVALALGGGLRRSECLGLQWSDIDFNARKVTVRQKRVRLRGEDIIDVPKTMTSYRTFTLTDWALASLKATRKRHLEGRIALGSRDIDLVVLDERGRPLSPQGLSHRFSGLMRAEGMRPITFKGLRHGFATLSVLAGVDLPTLAKRMGHSNTKITEIYYEILDAGDRAAAEKLNHLMDSAKVMPK